MKFICLIFFIMYSSISFANTNKANRCSSLFMIMTSIQKTNEGLGKYFTQQGRMTTTLTGLYLGEETGKRVTNGMLSKLKSNEMIKIGNNYPSNLSKVEEEISSCMGWTFAVGKKIQKNNSLMSKRDSAKKVLLSAPRPNKTYKYPFKDFDSIKSYIKIGFENWLSLGKVTPDTIRKQLKK